MSNFVKHLKLATENIVFCSDTCSKADHYKYAERMEKMLKSQLKEEMQEIVDRYSTKGGRMTIDALKEFIDKLKD